jgi:putative copper resistance protein D
VTGFLDVVLRGVALAAQAAAIGGVAFALLLRGGIADATAAPVMRRAMALVAIAAAALVVVQLALLAVLWVALGGDTARAIADVTGTAYFRANAIRVAACLALAAGAVLARRPGASPAWIPALIAPALVLPLSAALMSHAAARMEGRGPLVLVDVVHQLAAGVWIGGLLHLLVAAVGRAAWPAGLLPRFSTVALAAVTVLVAAGLALTSSYADGAGALVGTSYGLMVLTKIAILGGLLVLGTLNFVLVRRARAGGEARRVRRFVEVELGLGLTALFVAASLTSLPVAADIQADRATAAEVATRFTPRVPSLTSPPIEALPVDDRYAPRTDADRAWSEYNHHVAGLFVLVMGGLAILYATGRVPWARHWPLTFLGLAVFLLIRNDPGAWPLGPTGFWASMLSPEVLQHRIFVVLVIAFGVFEWSVRAGRLRSPQCALVFPLLSAVGGALLLTHSHATIGLKSEFLMEVTHAPLGLLGIAVGWGRWLELRLPPPATRLPGRLWAWSFALVGVLLLIYRES